VSVWEDEVCAWKGVFSSLTQDGNGLGGNRLSL